MPKTIIIFVAFALLPAAEGRSLRGRNLGFLDNIFKPQTTNKCTDSGDRTLWADGGLKFAETFGELRTKCLSKPSTERCVSQRFQYKIGYTEACSTCFGALAQCMDNKCPTKCQGEDAAACNSCSSEQCSASFSKCSGLSKESKYGDGTPTSSDNPLENAGSALLKYNGFDPQQSKNAMDAAGLLYNMYDTYNSQEGNSTHQQEGTTGTKSKPTPTMYDMLQGAYDTNFGTSTNSDSEKEGASTTSASLYDVGSSLFQSAFNSTAATNNANNGNSDLYSLYKKAYGSKDASSSQEGDSTSMVNKLAFEVGRLWGSSSRH